LSALWSLRFGPSPAAAALAGATHAAAAWSAYVALPALPAALCAAGAALSLGVLTGRFLHWSPRSVLGLELRADGSAAWQDRDGTWRAARGVAGVAFAPWLVVVALRDPAGPTLGLLVLPDAADTEARRRLRLWLRWRPTPVAAAAGGAGNGRGTGQKPLGQLN